MGRTSALPSSIRSWNLTTLREKPVELLQSFLGGCILTLKS
jgi:hypothetical protein